LSIDVPAGVGAPPLDTTPTPLQAKHYVKAL